MTESHPSLPPSLAPHLKVGRDGEALAVRYLRRAGLRVLDRNVRMGKDEIDIIAYDADDRVIVFTEVKARAVRSDAYHPELNLTFAKKRRLLRSARAWVGAHAYEGGWRIDVVCVAGGRVIGHYREISCA
jgi:putative endonuclease